LYQSLPESLRQTLKPCEPDIVMPADRRAEFPVFETWQQRRKRLKNS